MAVIRLIKESDFRLLFIVLLAFFLPIYKNIIPFFILFLALEWVIKKRWKNGFFDLTYLGFYSLFFLYQLFSLAWSDNWDYGGEDITMKLSLIIFPLLLGTKELRQFNYNLIFEYLIYGCLVLIGANYVQSILDFSITGNVEEFFYSKLSSHFHVAYASVYCVFGIASAYYLHTRSYKYFSNIWLTSLIVFILSSHVVLLNSKASFIAMMVVFLVIFLHFVRTKMFKAFIFPAMLVLITSISILFSFDYLYVRFFGGLEVFKAKEEQTISNNFNESKEKAESPVKSSEVRVVAWSTAIEIIKVEPFGVGVGDRKDIFIEKVGNKGYQRFKEKGLNTHNQYLQVLLAIGFPGFAIFLLNLFYPIAEAVKKKNFLLIAFVANISINIMFESMLEVQAGIIFYAFFSVLLVKQMSEEKATFPSQ